MTIYAADSALHAGLLGDSEIAALLAPEAEIAGMIHAEAALARVQSRLGVIPRETGNRLAEALENLALPPAELAAGMRKDGVAAPALVAALRRQLPDDCAPWLHFGATSQDIADLSLVLRLREVLAIFETRIEALIGTLVTLARAHRDTICLARTRSQQAAPTLFGLKAAQWLAPFLRHRRRIMEIRPRLLAVQFGGATGTLAALGPAGPAVLDALADELALARAEPWHAARDRLEEFAGLCAMLAGSCGKLGADLVILAQSEVGEIGFTGAGGSSTLPQKANPVIAEVLVSLARHAATLAGGMHQAAIHANERDGAAWTLEWLTLPPLILAAGAALARAGEALLALRIDEKRMQANLDASNGLVLAEAASFALAEHLPREAVAVLVKQGVAETLASGRHLFEVLRSLSDAPVDWARLAGLGDYLAPARTLIDRILDQV